MAISMIGANDVGPVKNRGREKRTNNNKTPLREQKQEQKKERIE